MKIVINTCYGGFSLSHEGVLAYAKRKGITLYPEKTQYGWWDYWTVPKEERQPEITVTQWYALSLEEREAHNKRSLREIFYAGDIPRDDPALVAVVEELGKKADGRHAELRVVEIPDGINWFIEEYDGREWVAERHRTWR